MTRKKIWVLLLTLLLLVANEWVLGRLIAADGHIHSPLKLGYIRLFDLLLVSTLLCFIARGFFTRVLYVLCILYALELTAAFAYRINFKEWHWRDEKIHSRIFEYHPYLVGAPRPNAVAEKEDVRITHNDKGYRGPNFANKGVGIRRIVAMGGSTTYGAGVTDGTPWPNQLAKKLGTHFEVINFGMLGYSSAEHIIQTALQLPELKADYVIYYVGWNDIRNSHVTNLRTDYSDFHGRTQLANLQLDSELWTGPRFALPVMLSFVGQRLGLLHIFEHQKFRLAGTLTGTVDQRALDIYSRNIRSLIALAESQKVRPIFVPQILNYQLLAEHSEPDAWIPFVPQKDLQTIMAAYNNRLVEICREKNVPFVNAVLNHQWLSDDFIDKGHFSVQGSAKFAELVAAVLK